jgi:hypothetical protein
LIRAVCFGRGSHRGPAAGHGLPIRGLWPDQSGQFGRQFAAPLHLPEERAGIRILREQFGVREPERLEALEPGFDRLVRNGRRVKLLLDIFFKTEAADSFHVAGPRAEGEAVEDMKGAPLFAAARSCDAPSGRGLRGHRGREQAARKQGRDAQGGEGASDR